MTTFLVNILLLNLKKKRNNILVSLRVKDVPLLRVLKQAGFIKNYEVVCSSKQFLTVRVMFFYLNFKAPFNRFLIYSLRKSYFITYSALKSLQKKNLFTQYILLSKGGYYTSQDLLKVKSGGFLKAVLL